MKLISSVRLLLLGLFFMATASAVADVTFITDFDLDPLFNSTQNAGKNRVADLKPALTEEIERHLLKEDACLGNRAEVCVHRLELEQSNDGSYLIHAFFWANSRDGEISKGGLSMDFDWFGEPVQDRENPEDASTRLKLKVDEPIFFDGDTWQLAHEIADIEDYYPYFDKRATFNNNVRISFKKIFKQIIAPYLEKYTHWTQIQGDAL